MKHSVDPADFESYVIPLPAGSRFGKKKESYIRGQLEKRHPCFSDSCCYDARYVFMGKELAVNTIVMDKVVLSRYRLQFPGKMLTVKVPAKNTENAGGKKVERRIFQQRSIVVPAVITPVVFSALVFGVFQPQQEMGVVTDIVADSVIVQEAPTILEPQPSALLEELFAAISGADSNGRGIILRFEFSRQNDAESISMELSGIYPESLQQILTYPVSFSPVTYHEGIPSFTLSLVSANEKKRIPEIEQTAALISQESLATDIVPMLRKIITESGGTMIQEFAGQGEVKFHIPSINFTSLMERLETLRAKSKAAVKKFSLVNRSGNQNSEFEGYIDVDIDINTGTISFKPFAEYPGLFTKHMPKPEIPKQIQKQVSRSIPASYTKIGEIQEGGKKCVFYRTPEGKIVRTEE
jgi:hypothetical protein